MDCHLAGRKYYDANEVWNQLQVGTPLRLVREADNRHDPDAIAVCYYDKCEEELSHIGYIPRHANEIIALLLEMGWTHIFDCRIRQLCPDAHPERQVQLVIKVKRNLDN